MRAEAARARPRAAPARWAGRLALHAAVIGLCLLWLLPTLGLLVSSFRPPRLVATTGWWTALLPPHQFTLDNYREVLGAYNMGRSFVNSLAIAIPSTIIPVMVAAYAAYAFAWMRFPGRDLLFTLVVGSLVVPLQMTLIPVLRLLTALGLVGTFPAVWLAHTGYGLPLAVYLLRTFIGALPRDLIESASLDGASPLMVFFRLILPLTVPALASLVIFQFLWVWNDLLVALIFVGGRPAVAPMTVTVSNLVNSLGQNWQLLTAAAFVSMALPLLVFVALQQYIVRGILAGAVKG
ncbi:MAG: carbohydrate ABC transporter permease [Armatimonadota bacterium]|nr:carbohydrate ABC transporter permease [Armatimonadota bacterium]MDR7401946.1 carbohydrate ABC transporter permease [Armatimonadota bacterium]MDR7403673.1 carbohydrate ABC transporter permease [Armatimonadota bacterium]MDR7437282.1 carbohydrate ABC transporter permease [Armatimonadota bacterium]MDR7471503.1 carbohydrate ABC transporter permease [Armatimonadota bacterium]